MTPAERFWAKALDAGRMLEGVRAQDEEREAFPEQRQDDGRMTANG